MLAKILRGPGLWLIVAILGFIAFQQVLGHYRGLHAAIETARADLAAEREAHGITLASLFTLEAQLASVIADGEARREAAIAARQAQSGVTAALTSQADRIAAERPGNQPDGAGRCFTPASVLQAEGL